MKTTGEFKNESGGKTEITLTVADGSGLERECTHVIGVRHGSHVWCTSLTPLEYDMLKELMQS
jgi:hypothetical protein